MDTIHLVYDSLKAFDQFSEKVHFSFRTLPSQITLKDISPFVPVLAAFQRTDNAGYAGKRNGRPAYLLSSGDYGRRPPVPTFGRCIASRTFESARCVVYGKLSELSANSRGVGFLVRNLSSNYNGVTSSSGTFGGY